MRAMKIDRLKLAAQLRKQKRTIRGVEYSPTVAAQFAKSLTQITKYITQLANGYIDYLRKIGIVTDSLAMFSGYVTLANREHIANLADAAAANAVKRIDKYQRDKFLSEFRSKAGVNLSRVIKAENLEATIQAKIKENIALITKATDEQLDRLNIAFDKAVLSGQETISLDEMVSEVGSAFESRAKLIARDQTSKFVSELNKERQTAVGIPGYYWRTAGDSAVRDSHAANDGLYFAWDDPPMETGHPGEDIQCRCVADPAIDRFLESLPEEIEE